MTRPFVASFAIAALFLAACSDDATAPTAQTTLDLTFSRLEPLANGFHYEGWAIVAGSALTTGKFNVSQAGGIVDLSGSPIGGGSFDVGVDISGASAIVITIEPNGDTDTTPADTHVLAGSILGSSAALAVGATQALGDDYGSAAGGFILATPTDGTMDDELSGIWFLDPAGPSPSLTLPVLPGGWRYEGWAVIEGVPVTSGRFTTTTDESAPFSGPNAGPPFPGEDYLLNAPAGLVFPTDLSGGTAVISIEPEPDDAAAPFTLKPLVGAIPGDAVDHVLYDLDLNVVSFPSGTAMIR